MIFASPDIRENLVLIVIPRLDNSGPVKGALALRSGLQERGYQVGLVALNKGDLKNEDLVLDISGEKGKGLPKKIDILRAFVREAEENYSVRLLTYCLEPDLVVALGGMAQKSVLNIRANLYQNYRYDFGVLGLALAFLNYCIAGLYAGISVQNEVQARHVGFFRSKTRLIRNFIDEPEEPKYSEISGVKRFIFVGGLNKRKRIVELVQCFASIRASGNSFFRLDVYGEGNERAKLEKIIQQNNLSDCIKLHGFSDRVQEAMMASDYFVLPSLSEGTSRAAMEALFYGLPCILRNVDNNADLIRSEREGVLVESSDDLKEKILQFIDRPRSAKKCLLPDDFRQEKCVSEFSDFITKLNTAS